jgi:small subunit ribosomal protein S7
MLKLSENGSIRKSPKKESLYTHILGFITKKGAKSISKKILDEAFFNVAKKLKRSSDLLLVKIFKKLNIYLEYKKVKRGRSTHIVPFPIRSGRRYYLAFKFLMETVSENKSKTPYSKKLEAEIFNLLTKEQSGSLKKKEDCIKLCVQNKSNLHYRW